MSIWSSSGGDDHRGISSSSSKSLSSSPSSSHSSILRNPRRKTIEEVWNNINLTCVHHSTPLPKPKTTTAPPAAASPVINNLQAGFLARPSNKHTHHKKQPKARTLIPRFPTGQVYHHPPPPVPVPVEVQAPAAPVPQPITPTISLNSVCDQQFPNMDDENNDENPLHPIPILNHNNLSFIDSTSFVSALNTSHPFDQAFGNTSLTINNNRRAADNNMNCTDGGDRRHKRMIKNRESAARSRARKQAYTNELELEVANLMEENAMLKKQQQQLYVAAAEAHQLPKKTTLQRTSTAPF